jgi:putative deaminase of polymorphic toxin system
MAGSRTPGPLCSYTNPIDIDDGTMCRAQSAAPGPVGTIPFSFTHKQAAKPVVWMTHEEKMQEAIRLAHEHGHISKEILNQLPGIQELAVGIVVVGGVLAGLGIAAAAVASTGVGAILEGIAAGIVVALAAVGIIASAGQIIAGIKTLMKFYEATRVARTHEDLETAGKDFATGIAEVGVGTVMMILSTLGARQGLKMGRGAANRWNAGKSLPEEPPPPRTTAPEPKPAPAPAMEFPNGIPPADGARLTSALRSSLQLEGRNVAVAETNIGGRSQMLTAVSGKASPSGTVPAPTDPLFPTKPSGAMTRAFDSEVKLLETIAKDLPSNAEGTVSLYTERPPCLSCQGVIQAFQQRFPNVNLIVSHGQ